MNIVRAGASVLVAASLLVGGFLPSVNAQSSLSSGSHYTAPAIRVHPTKNPAESQKKKPEVKKYSALIYTPNAEVVAWTQDLTDPQGYIQDKVKGHKDLQSLIVGPGSCAAVVTNIDGELRAVQAPSDQLIEKAYDAFSNNEALDTRIIACFGQLHPETSPALTYSFVTWDDHANPSDTGNDYRTRKAAQAAAEATGLSHLVFPDNVCASVAQDKQGTWEASLGETSASAEKRALEKLRHKVDESNTIIPRFFYCGGDPAVTVVNNEIKKQRSVIHTSEGTDFLSRPGKITPGGKIVNVSEDAECSVGYIVRTKKIYYVLTAGHCGEIGSQWSFPDENGELIAFGELTGREFDQEGGTDYAFITISPKAQHYISGSIPLNRISEKFRDPQFPRQSSPTLNKIAPKDWLVSNLPFVCRLGWRTGLSCGSMTGADAVQILARGISDHGDSGGPVFLEYKGSLYPAGIVSGGADGDALFSRYFGLWTVFARWQIELFTGQG